MSTRGHQTEHEDKFTSQMAVTSLNPTGESGKRLNVRNRTRAWIRCSLSPGLERALKPEFFVQDPRQ